MNDGLRPLDHYFVGWDVGGWNCARNPRSRDALVILNAEGVLLGSVWRGNLAATIIQSATTGDLIESLFRLCGCDLPHDPARVTLAIDAPLGFPAALTRLASRREHTSFLSQESEANPYLFRECERDLFARGFKPLSAIKDMIGSQTTKAMHVLARFASKIERCGVWTDGQMLSVIETYPAPCRHSPTMSAILDQYRLTERDEQPRRATASSIGHDDKRDALICALVARLFMTDSSTLMPPTNSIPPEEGWIWLPCDALQPQRISPSR